LCNLKHFAGSFLAESTENAELDREKHFKLFFSASLRSLLSLCPL